MRKHVAVISRPVIKLIFQGKKVIESRFSQKRIPPFGQVQIGDLIYIKPPGEDIVGQFKVAQVISHEGLGKLEWNLIKQNYGERLSLGTKVADKEYFKSHEKAQYATLIFIDRVEQFITSPIRLTKRDLRGWIVLD